MAKLINKYLRLAFEKAKINLGSTSTNPSVGCIIEKNKSVISSGHTSINGRPHAEFNALNKRINFKDSNLYVTLEPCSHYGFTPPCTNIIKKKKIKNVYFSLFDFDKRSNFKAKKILKKKRIIAKGNYLRELGLNFYKSYALQYQLNKPFIDAKIALSKDFYSISKKSKWITNIYSRRRGQFLRTQYNCLITTSKTVNLDNPRLDCRIDGLEKKSPDIIIIDRNFKLKKNLKLRDKPNKRKIIIITKDIYREKINLKRNTNFKYIFLKNISSKKDFENIFNILKKKGYNRIFVESGLKFLNFMIINKFINNIFIFQSQKKLRRNGMNNSNINIIKKLSNKKKLLNVNLFSDNLFKVKI